MDDKYFISRALQRPVVRKSKYARFMQGTACAVTDLGNGDTFHTVENMQEWVMKHLHHTEKLAPVLKGNTLKQTADNVYQFLYDHLQYLADGELQNLLSPGCAWAKRFEGADCKTFSIFASSILVNLGIQHAIRQVTQPGFYPDDYTHVYVVIPANQKTNEIKKNDAIYVIDGTRHQNDEVIYLKKHDTLMLRHQGLSSPRPTKSNCSYYGRALRTGKNKQLRTISGKQLARCRGLNAAATGHSELIENLNLFVNVLHSFSNVPLATCQAIQAEAMLYIEQGLEPKFNINMRGVTVGNKFFPYNKAQLNSPGLGIAFTAIAGMASTVLSSGNGEGGGWMSSVLGGLNLKENISLVKEFGLNSWGASGSPSKAQQEFADTTAQPLQQLVDKIKTASDLGKALTDVGVFLDVVYLKAVDGLNNHSKADSTKAANEWRMKNAKDLKAEYVDKIVNLVKSKGAIVQETKVPLSSFSYRVPTHPTQTWTQSNPVPGGQNHYVTQYTVQLPANVQIPASPSVNSTQPGSQQQAINTGGYSTTSTPTYTATPGNTNTYQPTGAAQPQKAGFGMIPAIVVIGGAATAYFVNKKKKK